MKIGAATSAAKELCNSSSSANGSTHNKQPGDQRVCCCCCCCCCREKNARNNSTATTAGQPQWTVLPKHNNRRRVNGWVKWKRIERKTGKQIAFWFEKKLLSNLQFYYFLKIFISIHMCIVGNYCHNICFFLVNLAFSFKFGSNKSNTIYVVIISALFLGLFVV